MQKKKKTSKCLLFRGLKKGLEESGEEKNLGKKLRHGPGRMRRDRFDLRLLFLPVPSS